jgi:tRNA nucleotidyltransferase (CCA-adding enzyme)
VLVKLVGRGRGPARTRSRSSPLRTSRIATSGAATPEIFLSAEKLYLVLKEIEENDSINSYLRLYDKLPIRHRSEMAVTGSDIMLWYNQTGGPWLKDTLIKVEHAIVEGRIDNDKHKIKEWLMECNQE